MAGSLPTISTTGNQESKYLDRFIACIFTCYHSKPSQPGKYHSRYFTDGGTVAQERHHLSHGRAQTEMQLCLDLKSMFYLEHGQGKKKKKARLPRCLTLSVQSTE